MEGTTDGGSVLGSLGAWLVEGTIDGRALPEGLRLVLGSSKIG